MKYQIIVIKFEDNAEYEVEMAKYKADTQYGMNRMMNDMPYKEKAIRSLEVMLTDEEYQKVKEEIIKVFE